MQQVDPEYFALTVRQAFGERDVEPDPYPADYLEGLSGPSTEDLLLAGRGELSEHPAVVEADERVLAAEIAVLDAEDAGQVDEVAQRRLDKARSERRSVLVRMQKNRTAAHTHRSQTRPAQVLPLRPFRVIRGGEAA
ncbi:MULTISPECIES: hypothetical protein [unclassified Saccharopolyspora]|uniref:hypothetical protein n=1 Tax=unclassified Saccharopolyspora TaxID=2646250 RepID=UPI001CD5ED80|nr:MULTISPECIES: hypothetical protein [unclassified Saccharopolyspora]MCA1191361.1 hypothetical protein [Saccharopolyspora sp. 6V]MCA1225037.1 hypothetical protein [Saccharopolyspora sp. 6M]